MAKVKDKTEKRIVQFLEENGPSFLGEVVKELKLSNARGLGLMNQLHSKGVIRHSDPPLQYELNSESK